MRPNTDITDDAARDVLNDLLSVNHGWWCDYIEEYTDAAGHRRQKLANRPYFSPSFLAMYGYSAEEMNPQAIFRDRETLRTVFQEIREVMRPRSKGLTGRRVAYTKTGERKLVEAYLRRIDNYDGTAMLASLHSDLTISSDVQWIEQNVLDKLQAFVFVKRWNPIRGQFVFTYMNNNLARVLTPDRKKLTEGLLSDDDFFDDWAQKRAFREVDEIIRDTKSPDLVVIREETFDPKPVATGRESNLQVVPSRLLTFKTPLSIPSRDSILNGWEVLGIAIDVTSVTDVLRSIADKSESGLYIKDDKRRYHYLNNKFLELLQAPGERQILDRTFAEALKGLTELGAIPWMSDIEQLAQLINMEDNEVFAGETKIALRVVPLPKPTDWLTQKQPIKSQDDKVTHLLGVTSPLFPGRLGDILDKLPQCISVKKYYSAERDQPGEFKIVWANRSFLDIHGKKELADVIGITDTDLWPGDPEQVAQFRRNDRLVVESYQRLSAEPGWAGLSLGDRWERIVSDCHACGCWEFRETTRSKTQTRVLQTTKWAESINESGAMFVVVVYSDVTIGNVEQQRYHEMTTHNLRGATGPNSNALSQLQRVLDGAGDVDARVRAAIASLQDSSHAVELFLMHHLKLLKMDVECRPTQPKELIDFLREEGEKLKRNWSVTVDIGDGWSGGMVSCDLTLLRFAFSELLLNAAKATHRRSEELTDADRPQYTPSVSVRFERSGSELRCIIRDNGAACNDQEHRERLVKSFNAAKVNPFNPDSRSFGLSFCIVALRAQSGRIELVPPTDIWTAFEVHLPIILQGDAT